MGMNFESKRPDKVDTGSGGKNRRKGRKQHKEVNKFMRLRNYVDRVIGAFQSHRWYDAYRLTFDLETVISQIMIINDDDLDRKFDTLRMRILRDYNGNRRVKKKACMEGVEDILKTLSDNGLFPKLNDSFHGLKKILEVVDQTIMEMVTKRKRAEVNKDFKPMMDDIFVVKQFLNNLVTSVKLIPTTQESEGIAESIVSNAIDLRSKVDYIISDENIDEIYTIKSNLAQLVDKLETTLERPEKASMVKDSLEKRGIRLPSGASVVQEIVGQKEFRPGSFDWVDEEWKRVLKHPTILTIVGQRDMGKSQLGYALIEYYMNQYEVDGYLFSPVGMEIAEKARQLLPKGVRIVDNINEVKNNSVVLFDEAHIAFHSRTSMKDMAMVFLDKVIELTRHKNQTHIYVTQRTSKLDRNIFSGADTLLIKKPGKFQVRMERGELKDVLEKAAKEFDRVERQLGDTLEERRRKRKGYVYVSAEEVEKLKHHGICSFWNEQLSTLFG